MQSELQDCRNASACLPLDLSKAIDVPGVEHQRLFADCVDVRSQCETTMGVVQIVRRANRHEVNLLPAAAHLVDVAVEALKLDKEARVRKITINDPDGIIRIKRNLQFAADRLDCTHVTRSDVPRSSDQSKRLHLRPLAALKCELPSGSTPLLEFCQKSDRKSNQDVQGGLCCPPAKQRVCPESH